MHIFCAKAGAKQVQNNSAKNLETGVRLKYLVSVINERGGKTPLIQLKKKHTLEYELRQINQPCFGVAGSATKL